jgi:hypothetical protein
MPFRIAASDKGEPSVGNRMCLNILPSLRFRNERWLDAVSIGYLPVGVEGVVVQEGGMPPAIKGHHFQ